jgi:ammonium transporter, Amt family
MTKIDTGDTAWLLVSCALVLLMTPALALFYGGLVGRKNVLSTIMHSMAAIPILSIKWALFGYSLAFGTSYGGLIGGGDFIGMKGVAGAVHGTVPALAFAAFQMMFAVITPALISGAFAERMKFSAYVVFILAWSTLVYDPVCHWVWGDGGWLLKLGALDFAGGTVVHLTAGVSALVCALVIGKRLGYPKHRSLPHNLTMCITGAGLLWFGWFGFNAGSALASGQLAAVAFMATHLGAAGGAVGWVIVEWMHRGKPTALGLASGLVAGLVGITPAAGFVAPWAAIVVGLAAGLACYGGVLLKDKLGYDDALDAFGVHGVGGLVGALLTGVFAEKALNEAGADGLLAGNAAQLGTQGIAVLASGAYAAVLTFGILKVIDATIGLRVLENDEREGLDSALHGEQGYGAGSIGSSPVGNEGHVESAPLQPERAVYPVNA